MFGKKKVPKKEVNKNSKKASKVEEKAPQKHISKEVLTQINNALEESPNISEINISCLFEEDAVKKKIIDKLSKIEVKKATIDRFDIGNYGISVDEYVSIFQEALNCRIKEANLLDISVAHVFAQMFNTDYNDIKDCFKDVTKVKLKCVYNNVVGERLKKFVTIPCETSFNYPIVIYATNIGTNITTGLKNVDGKLLINTKEDVSCCAVLDIIPV